MTSRTIANLEGVHPLLAAMIADTWHDIRRITSAYGARHEVICGHRPQSDQDRLYQLGRRGVAGERKVTWTKSSHHTLYPARAIDLGLFRGGSYLDETDALLAHNLYRDINEVFQRYSTIEGFELTWGGGFGDDPHWQIRR